jgi:hypothetical protein
MLLYLAGLINCQKEKVFFNDLEAAPLALTLPVRFE